MIHRMATAVLSLVGFLISLYLWLWKLGLLGPIVCVSGGCETVQLSQYSILFGLPVALYGVVGFAAILAVSLVGLQANWLGRRGPTTVLLALALGGVVFAGYLTYIEAALIHAWCQWCVICALLITAILATSLVATIRWPKDSPISPS